MTYLNDSRFDTSSIRKAVSLVLAPLLRRKNPHFVLSRNCKENGRVHPEEKESDDDEDEVPDFESMLADERDSGRNSFSPSKCMQVILDWTEKEQVFYDLSFLDDLPEVYKHSGFFAKKTKQEGVNLFSCLEAFLKEEPLGPDDMW